LNGSLHRTILLSIVIHQLFQMVTIITVIMTLHEGFQTSEADFLIESFHHMFIVSTIEIAARAGRNIQLIYMLGEKTTCDSKTVFGFSTESIEIASRSPIYGERLVCGY
jgi:hypothetical protein